MRRSSPNSVPPSSVHPPAESVEKSRERYLLDGDGGTTTAGAPPPALVALVANGWVNALFVVGLIVLVNQLEGNFLQPVLMGRSMKLHSFVILIALTVGTVLGGIVGAVLAVPITAVAWGIVQVWDGPNTPARWARRKSTEPTPS